MISSAYTAEDWPIAAAMLPFGNKDSRGGPIHDAEPAEWAKQLRLVRHIGFTEVDPTDTWVRVGDLSPQRLSDFNSVLSEVGLTIPAISTSRRSVMDPAHGEVYRRSGRDWPSKRGRWRRAAGTLLLSISTPTAWPA